MDSARCVYLRYLKLEPGHTEEYIQFLKSHERWGEVAERLILAVSDDNFTSINGKSKHQLWLELCDVLTKYPAEVTSINVDAILRGGIQCFAGEVAQLWISLADYYIRRGLFEEARNVYEDAIASVITVRDFSLIFDAYSQFEESTLSAKINLSAATAHFSTDCTSPQKMDGKALLLAQAEDDLDLRLARLEYLMSRRQELLSSVVLRQNPHSVHEWHKRVSLFEGDLKRQILTFTEAIKTVNPSQAIGKPLSLLVEFAKIYELHCDYENALLVFEKATGVPYTKVEDLAIVWCEWAEYELRHKNYKEALTLLRRATAEHPDQYELHQNKADAQTLPVRGRLYKSIKLWTFYADLEESLGTLESTRVAYDRIFDLQIATPQTVLNYAHLLEDHKLFDESFRIYERGVNMFCFPFSGEIWMVYLKRFLEHFGAKKIDRARELFEQVCSTAPQDVVKSFYLEYARMEEQCGLSRRAMDVYDRACQVVPHLQKLDVYELYITRALEFFGVRKVRSILDSAIQHELPTNICKVLCMWYARLERNLGEFERSRSLYTYASQFSNPGTDAVFWEEWNRFEVRYGNEDSFREMLQVKRTVKASFSQLHFNMATVDAAVCGPGDLEPGRVVFEGTVMKAQQVTVEEAGTGNPTNDRSALMFIQSNLTTSANSEYFAADNPDEISIDMK